MKAKLWLLLWSVFVGCFIVFVWSSVLCAIELYNDRLPGTCYDVMMTMWATLFVLWSVVMAAHQISRISSEEASDGE